MGAIGERADAGMDAPSGARQGGGRDGGTAATPQDTSAERATERRPASRRRNAPDGAAPVFETIEAAAAKLSLEAAALRARCRRAARLEGDAVVAPLGGGIVAIKFGRSWRVRFPTA